jgi:hypothetical protein
VTKAFVVPDAAVAAARDLCGARALLAVAGLFTVNGVLIGGVGATLPAMRQRLAVASVVLIARVVGEGGVVVTPALASLGVLCAVAFLTISRWVPRTASVRAVTRPGGGPRLSAGALLLGAMTLQARPVPAGGTVMGG